MPQMKSGPSPSNNPIPLSYTSATGRAQALSEAVDREHLLDRLQQLRDILPVFAQELAGARRQAAALRLENRGLQEELHRQQALNRNDDGAVGR